MTSLSGQSGDLSEWQNQFSKPVFRVWNLNSWWPNEIGQDFSTIEIKKLKTKITTETEAHRDRAEKTKAQGKADVYQANEDHKGQLEYWHKKCCTLETKKAEQVEQHKMALSKMSNTHKLQEVSLPISFRFTILPLSILLLFTSHFICLDWDKWETQWWNGGTENNTS